METRILLDLFIIFAAAKIVGEIFDRLHQPAVVGEILAGIIFGPHLLGLISDPAQSHTLQAFAEVGVIFLLFVVGLGTRTSDMLKVGKQATWVAVLGVALPFGLGLGLMLALQSQLTAALFVATALVATSVGITARVLADLGQASSRPARIILSAAVIDDILGLIILSIVSGMAKGQLTFVSVGLVILLALGFTVFVLVVGRHAAHRLSANFYRLHISDPAFAISVALCLGLSALAGYVGLAAIVGAFLAGMAFAETREAEHIRKQMDPIYDLLVPIFFVIMGAQVDVRSILQPSVLGLGLAITALAIIGKLIGCGFAARSLGKRDALTIGIGMMPRGEVGIVVATIGLNSHTIGRDIYAVVIFMSIVTTLLAPPLLRKILRPNT
jgi:Kef-type K+ transport system membrane component KefB